MSGRGGAVTSSQARTRKVVSLITPLLIPLILITSLLMLPVQADEAPTSEPPLIGINPAVGHDGEYESFSPELAEQLGQIYQQEQSLTPVQRKIDWNILQVIREVKQRISAAHPRETPRLRDLSTRLLRIDDAGNIEIKLSVTSLGHEQIEQLEARGMQIGCQNTA